MKADEPMAVRCIGMGQPNQLGHRTNHVVSALPVQFRAASIKVEFINLELGLNRQALDEIDLQMETKGLGHRLRAASYPWVWLKNIETSIFALEHLP